MSPGQRFPISGIERLAGAQQRLDLALGLARAAPDQYARLQADRTGGAHRPLGRAAQ